MNETKAMEEKGWKFYLCAECGRQYPAKQENPESLCLSCLQTPNLSGRNKKRR